MNILGAGPGELVIVFVIMLVIAGPKRMVRWAYVLGQYTAQLRQMWQQTLDAFKKELADANLDLPKDLNIINKGRFDILGEANKIINAAPDEAKPAEPATKADEEGKRYDSWLPN
jgi:Sec-independent protein translocase protein TatA